MDLFSRYFLTSQGLVEVCALGVSSIWSLRRRVGERTVREVTIEYRPATGKITQANTKQNGAPDRFQTSLIRRWAVANEITMEPG